MIGALTNHLWQSTVFVLAAAIVAAALRHNGAHVRHAIWVIASVKFLVPFAWLMSLGALLPQVTPAVSNAAPDTGTALALPIAVHRLAAPFAIDVLTSPAAPASAPAPGWTTAIIAAWSCGFAIVALIRWRDWRRIRAAVRASVPTTLTGPVPVRAFAGLLGPGVVGVWRPILLVPAGIRRCLTPAQLQTMLEHEFCHVRRRDNLTSAIHMVVESLFWFHPLVWWIGARIVEERERACDEHVLRGSGRPEEYAESILNVCRFYVESRLACVSGVAGSDLKKRIAAIMGNRVGMPLSSLRKAALTTMAVFVVALPMWTGFVTAPLGALGAAAAPRQRFDVVSIRPCPEIRPAAPRTAPSGGGRGAVAPWAAQTSPGYVYWHCVTLAQLVDQAYADADHPLINTIARPQQDSVQPKRVRGGPAWVDRDMFTIEARAPLDLTNPALKGRPVQNLLRLPPELSAALRATLEDRFQVQVRRETEQRRMFALRVAKTGLETDRIKATQPGDCVTVEKYFEADPAAQRSLGICGRYRVSAGAWEVSGMTLKQIAGEVSEVMDRVLVDETGVDTPFSFVLELGRTPADEAVDTRFIRAFGALGLTIAETRGPAEYLVIDRAQKPRPDGPFDSVDAPAHAKGPGR
jgi:uncharacterized protein (TIGR03435 family)